MLALIRESDTGNGWGTVSDAIMPLIVAMPSELVRFEYSTDGTRGGRVGLTELGMNIIEATKWL